LFELFGPKAGRGRNQIIERKSAAGLSAGTEIKTPF
jgi:hypothetical protein